MSDKTNNAAVKELSLPVERAGAQVFWITAFAVLTAIGAQIEIPNHPVPYTLQTFFVLLAGALLGKRNGMISMCLYLLAGAAGMPVFSSGASGFLKIFGPTGGYLLSFPIAAYAVGFFVELRRELWWMILSMLAGSFLYFAIGTIYLNIIYTHDWISSFQMGFLIFSLWDAMKIIGAATFAYYFRQINRQN